MTKILIRVCLILILLLIILYTYLGIFMWKQRREKEDIKKKVDIVLKDRYPAAELVTGVGIYQVLKYSQDDTKQQNPVVLRGVVKMGIDIEKLKVDYFSGQVVITYPDIRIISMEVLNLVDVSGELIGTQFYNDVHAMKRLYLKQEALRRGLRERSEENLRKELMYIGNEIAQEKMIVIQSEKQVMPKAEL